MPSNPLFLPAGELRQKVTIEAPNTAEPDAYGQPTTNWTTILTTRAKIDSTTGSAYKEASQDGQLISQSTWMITIRYPGSNTIITPGQRVVWGTQTFIVQAVIDVLKRHRVLRLYCTAIDQASN